MNHKKLISVLLLVLLSINLVGCSFESAKETAKETASTAIDSVGDTAGRVKDKVVGWYDKIDFEKFKQGWDASAEFMGAQYAAVMSSEYVVGVEMAISALKSDINAAASSARGTAQEAGFLAEKWAADTFNINAVANGSEHRAEVVGSNKLGSVDVKTTYGENVSLKYYQSGDKSASAQARAWLEKYSEYCSRTPKEEQLTPAEYMNKQGYDPEQYDAIMKSVYDGQTRVIPADQITEATAYLRGEIDRLSLTDTEGAARYQETLSHLKDRLRAPDGTESVPLSYDEAQAIAELAHDGDFKPEDFGITLSRIISPKLVVKEAIGTGTEVALLNTVLTIGPDIYSILKEAIINGNLDETALKETGIEGVVAAGEGFVEGAVSRVVTTLCQTGAFGEALTEANPSIVATLMVIVIEAAIHGCELAQGKITPEEYGNMMVDRLMVGLLALPTSALFLAILPATKIAIMAGCMAGGMLACVGYMVGKKAIMDIVDAGGFEAVVPVGVTNTFSVATEKIKSIDIVDNMSSFKDSVISTAKDGYIKISTIIKD